MYAVTKVHFMYVAINSTVYFMYVDISSSVCVDIQVLFSLRQNVITSAHYKIKTYYLSLT